MVVYTFAMRKCEICGDPSYHPYSPYCTRCKKLIQKGIRRKIKRDVCKQALKNAWKGDGFYCYYCKRKLEEKNSKSPCYMTFDHVIPRQNDKIVIAAAIINDMKSDMSEYAFRKMVIALAKCFNGGDFDFNCEDLRHYKR